MSKVETIIVHDEADVFIVADIHGCYDEFMEKLISMGFRMGEDICVAVGDLVDRGKNNEAMIALLEKHWFFTSKGNHEDFCVKGYFDSSIEFYHKLPNNGGEWFYQQSDEMQRYIIDKFNNLPILIELHYKGRKYGIVHADVPVNDWELLKEMVENDEYMSDGRSVVDHCLWARNVVNFDTVHIENVDRVFLGHTILPEIKHVGNCTFLDTGCVFSSQHNPYHLSIIKL